jgi:hypothetical protein
MEITNKKWSYSAVSNNGSALREADFTKVNIDYYDYTTALLNNYKECTL